MSVLAQTLTKKEFKNWVKGALALLFTKDALTDFVSAEVDRHHQRLLQLVPAANTLNTCNCTIYSLPPCTRSRNHSHIVPGPRQLCSRGVCNILMDAICKDHRFKGPSWKNTYPQKWCTDAFEVAKCFFPPDGYSHKTSLSETDFNGVLSVIINNLSFSSLIQDNLAKEPNVCTKARKVGREIRHTADHLLSDSDLRDYIDYLINLLCDPACLLNDPSAQYAVRKLRLLKANDLNITEKDITEALKENIKDTFSDEHRDFLQKINDHYSKLQTDSVAEIDRIVAVKKTELEEHANKLKEDFTRHAELKKQEMEECDEMKEKREFEEKFKEFKEELVRFYNEKESVIPASPLVEDHAVPLIKLYVQPPMSAFIKPNAFGQGMKSPEKTSVSSYRKLFLNDDNVPYKNIYVEANAGNGKTSFTQKVAVTWCLAQNPSNSTISKDQQEDVDTLKRFDLLFLLHLRDFHGDDTCLLDDLIHKFVSKNLPSKRIFSKEFIGRMLQNKTCLVILDGLDEWVHPETCRLRPGIPHNNYRECCTQLTTTRPWKLSTIGLTPNQVDRHIEISMLDDKTSKELKSNAFKLLSENSGEREPDLNDFDRKVSSVKLGDIRLIPYILLQLICIWFDGLNIGKSKCETYSNTIELTLQRGLNKKNAPTLPVAVSGGNVFWVWQFLIRKFQYFFPTRNAERNVTVPECLRHNMLCNQYMNLLLKLGKLAFYALFQKIKESSLVIESSTVLEFLTEQELEFCLKIGLLSQSKDRSKVSVKRYQVYFQHKSVQEFMAALYIVSEWNNGTIQSTIVEVFSSLSSILEMENLLVFVCGLNPEVYTCISGELQKIIDLDRVTCTYRTYMCIVDDFNPDYYSALKTMKSYQSMQLECLQESLRNGHDSCPIPLYFVLDKHSLTYDVKALKSIMQVNESIGESPQVSLNGKILASMLSKYAPFVFMQSLDPGVFTSLETLRVESCREEPIWLADILTESARTLKCLTLPLHSSLSDISITALTGLTCLQSLYLVNVLMTYSNLKCLYGYISQTTTLTQLKLQYIRCSDQRGLYHDCDVTLDLHRLNELKMLHLFWAPCRELHVNPECLEKLMFWPLEEMTARASATLWQDLRAAPVLSSLTLNKMRSCQEMIQTIPTLTQLQHLWLFEIDMDDVLPRVSPAMTQLEWVVLDHVTMSSAAWQKLFVSVDQLPRSITVLLSWITMTSQAWRELLISVGQLQHPVTVRLESCHGPSEEEWLTIVNVIKTTPTLSLLQDLRFSRVMFGRDDAPASLTVKKH